MTGMTAPRIVEQVPVYDGWYRLYRLGAEMPGGAVVERHLLECRPAGNLDGQEPEACARQEALEEAGLQLRRPMQPVACIWPMPPIATERVHLYLTEYSAADRIGAGGGAQDEHEHVAPHEIALDELRTIALTGRLTDAKTLILAQALLLARPNLWATRQEEG
jgi:hypothetical protein